MLRPFLDHQATAKGADWDESCSNEQGARQMPGKPMAGCREFQLQVTLTVNCLALSARSAGSRSAVASPGGGVTPLVSRKLAAVAALIAKLTFCARSLVTRATLSTLSFATITPIALPRLSSSGPPLLPGW